MHARAYLSPNQELERWEDDCPELGGALALVKVTFGSIGFDVETGKATDKWPPETKREWGEVIRMDEAVVERVSDMWSRLGLPGDGKPIWK